MSLLVKMDLIKENLQLSPTFAADLRPTPKIKESISALYKSTLTIMPKIRQDMSIVLFTDRMVSNCLIYFLSL